MPSEETKILEFNQQQISDTTRSIIYTKFYMFNQKNGWI